MWGYDEDSTNFKSLRMALIFTFFSKVHYYVCFTPMARWGRGAVSGTPLALFTVMTSELHKPENQCEHSGSY